MVILNCLSQESFSDNLANWIIAAATVIYTIGSLALWLTTTKQIKIMKAQQELLEKDFEKQTKYLESVSTRSIVDSHRDIFFNIINDTDLIKIFSKNSNSTISKAKEKILASIIINHAQSIWLDFFNGIKKDNEFDSFSEDFADILNSKFMKFRWKEVKKFHSKEFREFVDSIIKD